MPIIYQNKTVECNKKEFSDIKSGYNFLKRCVDLLLSFIAFPAFSVIYLIVAIFLKIQDGGPVLYKAERVGLYGKKFYMYKFRTMRPNSDKIIDNLVKQNEMDGPVFKMKEDPRITRVGKFLRKVSLDELMQFFNVLKGDMTLVGPRPPLPREVQFYTDYQRLRLLVTPGITCTWQIHKNRNDVPFEEWVEMDIEYIQTRTYLNDLIIMLKTPIVMLTATGR